MSEFQNCSLVGIPKRLYWKEGLPIDNSFDNPNEPIYRWFDVKAPHTEWEKNKKLSAKVFKLQNDSFCRDKYCEDHTDVLYNDSATKEEDHNFREGVLSIPAGCITSYNCKIDQIPKEKEPRVYVLQIVHDPKKCVYPHCELHIYYKGEKQNRISSNLAKNAIRLYLLAKKTILKTPDN